MGEVEDPELGITELTKLTNSLERELEMLYLETLIERLEKAKG